MILMNTYNLQNGMRSKTWCVSDENLDLDARRKKSME